MKDIKTQGWVVITPTLCSGDVIASSTDYDGHPIPVIHDTEESAWAEIADDKIQELQQFIDGERSLEDTSFGTDEYVAELYWHTDDQLIVYDEQGNPVIETTLEQWRSNR